MIQKGIRILKEIKIPRADVRSCVNNKFDPANEYKIDCGRYCTGGDDAYSIGTEGMGFCPSAFEGKDQCYIVVLLIHEALHGCFWKHTDELYKILDNAKKRCLRHKGK